MRKLVPFVVSLGLAACADEGPWSPSDPAKFDRAMFHEDALSGFDTDGSAYVMGHAIGVYLMGKTVPAEVADHGYLYRPGKSSPHAAIAYNWERVLRARSGGSDGNGGAIYDDVSIDDSPQNGTDDPYAGDDEPTGTGDPSDDVGDPGGDGGDGTDECGIIEYDCEAFLSPAADRARAMARQVDPARFAPTGLAGADLERFSARFDDALWEAIALELLGEYADHSEVAWLKDEAKLEGRCVD